jgi:HPt (histidine-containing phosphotransfer) domain-containing protein
MAGASVTIDPIYSTLGCDPDLAELVDWFVGEVPNRLASLRQSFDAHDWSELGRLAHQIKGAAGSYGFPAVTPIAARLESAAKSAEPEDQILTALDELTTICCRLRSGGMA